MVLLALLTTLAFAASLATATRVPKGTAVGEDDEAAAAEAEPPEPAALAAPAEPEPAETDAPAQSPAERLVATMVVLNALLVGPVYVLGLANVLTRATLGRTVVVLSVGLLGFAYHRGLRPKALARAWLDCLLLPLRAAWATVRTASFTSIGFAFAVWFLVWTAIAVVHAPTWRDWDGPWYHESMVGFTLQNHGFSIVPLPEYLQKINGYQRLGEMSQLWFAMWAGRPMVEASNLFYSPILVGSVYLLTRRYTRDRVTAIAWSIAFLLVPGNARLLQSTMVDPHAAALFVAAAFYATEERLTLRTTWLAIVALTMAVGAKTFLLIPGFFLALLFLARLIANRRELGGKATAGTIALGSTLLIGMVCETHLRNYIYFRNPVWPDLSVDVPSLGIHWKGMAVLFDPDLPTTQRVNANVDASDLYEKIIAPPWSNTWGDHSWQIADYGPGVSWFALPVGLLVCVVVALVLLRDLVWRLRKRPVNDARATRTRLAAMLAVPVLFAYAASPAVYIGRYHTALVGLLFGLLAWVGSHARFRRFSEGLPLMLQLTAIMMTLWTPAARRYWLTTDQMKELWRTPSAEREVAERLGAPLHEATGLAREAEIHAGDVVGFDGLHFVSLLWNNQYSNYVAWLGAERDPLGKAEAIGAKWVCAGRGTVLGRQVAGNPRWVLVGWLEAERFSVVYRRR